MPRTGTNLLAHSLAQPRHVFNAGEVMRAEQETQYPWWNQLLRGKYGSRRTYQIALASLLFHSRILPVDMALDITRYIHIPEFVRDRRIIYKSLFTQCPMNYHQVWSYIWDETDDKILIMNRKHKLRQMVSSRHAYATGEWWVPDARDANPKQVDKIDLTFHWIVDHQTFAERHYDYFSHWWKNSDRVRYLDYEDLADNFSEVTRTISEWLEWPELKGYDFKPRTKKQITKPHIELIPNWDELFEQAKGTKWEQLFHEELELHSTN